MALRTRTEMLVKFRHVVFEICERTERHVRPGSAVVRALDLRLKRRGFESRPFRFHVTILGKLFTHMCLCHQAV